MIYRLNKIRTSLPYAYWLIYDLVIAALLVYGFVSLSHVFAAGFPFLLAAAFFDVVELIVKWQWRHGEFRVAPDHRLVK